MSYAIAIDGPAGAGKSTILKIITGVLNPTEGEVEINGRISALLELGAGFDQNLTARENIYLNGAILGYTKQFLDERFDNIGISEFVKLNAVILNHFAKSVHCGLAGNNLLEVVSLKLLPPFNCGGNVH